MYISTPILGCSNAASMSHIYTIHPSSSWYKVSPIRILVEVSDTTGKNDFVKSTPGTCMYPLTTFLEFRRIYPSAYSLLFNTHLTYDGFIPLAFMAIIFVVIHAFMTENYLLHKL